MLSQRSKKHHHAGAPNIVPDPLVNPGNPPHRHQARSAAHLDRPCSRMVALAASSPGRRTPRSPQTENATVMLSDGGKAPLVARRVGIVSACYWPWRIITWRVISTRGGGSDRSSTDRSSTDAYRHSRAYAPVIATPV